MTTLAKIRPVSRSNSRPVTRSALLDRLKRLQDDMALLTIDLRHAANLDAVDASRATASLQNTLHALQGLTEELRRTEYMDSWIDTGR